MNSARPGDTEDRALQRKLWCLVSQGKIRLGKKAARLREEGKAVDALLTLKAARRRFEITRSAAGLQKLIEELDR